MIYLKRDVYEKILIIEDDESVRNELRELLSNACYEVAF